MKFWHDNITEKSFEVLQELKGATSSFLLEDGRYTSTQNL